MTRIQVEIHCTSIRDSVNPSYRLYLNDTLMTERTFIWPQHYYIDEEMIAELPSGVHTVSVQNCKNPGNFAMQNVRIDGKQVDGIQFRI